MWHLYILKCADGTLYTGISNDVAKRLADHNAGKGAKYTRVRLPVELVYDLACGDRSAAAKEEYRIKKLSREEKLELVYMKI